MWCSCQVRLQDADQADFIRAAIALNGESGNLGTDGHDSGLQAITFQTSDVQDLAVAGLVQLDLKDYVSVWVMNDKDNDFVILRESLFSGAFISSPNRTVAQCIEKKNAAQKNDVCSACIKSGASCSRCANIFGFDCSCACLTDHCTETPNMKYGGDTCSDCLHSGASCKQCSSQFKFNCSCACNDVDVWDQWRPNRCFGVNCGDNGVCHEGSCVCKNGHSGTNCILPPGKGMFCGSDDEGNAKPWTNGICDTKDDGDAGKIDLGESESIEKCNNLCRSYAESGKSLEGGCCQRSNQTGTSKCFYYKGVTEIQSKTESDKKNVATICSLADVRKSLTQYSLRERDCRDIQPVTEHLVEAVIKLHAQLTNRACVDKYYENEFGICVPEDPKPEPIVQIGPNGKSCIDCALPERARARAREREMLL